MHDREKSVLARATLNGLAGLVVTRRPLVAHPWFNSSSLLSHLAGWIRKCCFQRTDSLGEQEPKEKNTFVSIAV